MYKNRNGRERVEGQQGPKITSGNHLTKESHMAKLVAVSGRANKAGSPHMLQRQLLTAQAEVERLKSKNLHLKLRINELEGILLRKGIDLDEV